jgi:hypothetical protein
VRYAIKSNHGVYYRDTVAICPRFGPLTHAHRFTTKREAIETMCTHTIAFVECRVVPVGDKPLAQRVG